MPENVQRDYIRVVVAENLLPAGAHRMEGFPSLGAPSGRGGDVTQHKDKALTM